MISQMHLNKRSFEGYNVLGLHNVDPYAIKNIQNKFTRNKYFV